jgi:hypothetical protein
LRAAKPLYERSYGGARIDAKIRQHGGIQQAFLPAAHASDQNNGAGASHSRLPGAWRIGGQMPAAPNPS